MDKLTIQEVAQAAGVSKGTVSRVLNGRDGVNSNTRQHVSRVVSRLGYVPDPEARRLARGARRFIGLNAALGDFSGPYFELLEEGLQKAFEKQGFQMHKLLTGTNGLPEGQADGLVLLGVPLDDPRPVKLKQLDKPFVMVGHSITDTSWIDVDNFGGMREATMHLLKLGHRRIAHLGAAHTWQASVERARGFAIALQEAGIANDQSLIWDGNFTALGGYRAVRRALEKNNNKPNFSAIAAASDEMALGAIAALSDAGLRVPWDVSVLGFDDLPMASAAALTTVRQPILEIGAKAAHLLLQQINKKRIEHEVVKANLVVRSSTAACSPEQG